MLDFPHLKKAPIVEATIEVRCEIADILDSLKAMYTEKFSLNFSELKTQNISFNPVMGNLSVPAPTFIGWEARNETDVIQIRKDGLLFSRIKEYDTFEDLNKYIKAINQSNIIEEFSRIGCRYINMFSIPKELFPRDLYALSIYNEEESKEQQIFKREVSKIGNFNIILINNIAKNNDDTLNITLDIDVSTFEKINIKQIDNIIKDIRNLKNKIFFKFIEKYKEAFN